MIYGSFKNLLDEDIYIEIIKVGANGYEIGDNNTDYDICFSSDPITISQSDDDIDSPIIIKTCTIRLISSVDIYDAIFAVNPWDVSVNVWNVDKNVMLFTGFVKPMSYNQDYSEKWNEIEIECTDYLGTLENKPFIHRSWPTAVASTHINTFKYILTNRIFNMQLDPEIELFVLGDDSFVSLINSNFNLKCNEMALLGDKEDEHKSCADALTSILNYLGLKILGTSDNKYYIFDKSAFYDSSFSNWRTWQWDNSTIVQSTLNRNCTNYINLDAGNGYVDGQYDITVEEPITKMKVNVDRKEIDDVVPNLFDDNITFNYGSRALFLTEYSTTNDIFGNKLLTLLQHRNDEYPLESVTSDQSAWMRNWYIRVLSNTGWTIYDRGGTDISNYRTYPQSGVLAKRVNNQDNYSPRLCDILVEDKRTQKKSLKELSISENRLLFIPINGNNKDEQSGTNAHMPQWSNLQTANTGCMIKYESSGDINYSPADDSGTNYLIFTGNLGYAPKERTTYVRYGSNTTNEYNTSLYDIINCGTYKQRELYYISWNKYETKLVDRPCITGGYINMEDNRRFYAQRFYADGVEEQYARFMVPMAEDPDKASKLFQYNYSQTGTNNNEKIDKIPMLLCSLQIGNKYLKEEFVEDIDGYKKSEFTWVNDSTATFSIGISPEKDDYIIGTFYEFKNSVPSSTGIKTKGMGIPIKKSDNLYGHFIFKIICPLEPQYNEGNRKTQISMTSNDTRWGNAKYILSHVSSICIKSFKISLESGDNADKVSSVDLCYMSDVSNNYVKNEKEVDFDLCSALTTQESSSLSVDNGIYSNSVYNNDDTLCTYLYEYNGTQSKAEEAFIHKWYDIISQIRRIYKVTIPDVSYNVQRNYGNMLLAPYFTIYNNDGTLTNTQMNIIKSIEFDVRNNNITFEGEKNN